MIKLPQKYLADKYSYEIFDDDFFMLEDIEEFGDEETLLKSFFTQNGPL